MGIISTQSIPDLQENFPTETPAFLVGRLAVDISVQKQGLGKKLLRHAFECAIDISHKIGVWAVYVKAKDESVKKYYQNRGFISLKNKPLVLFLPLQTIRKAMQQNT
nr:GNAT family N-acetyltransferase [Spirulina major]